MKRILSIFLSVAVIVASFCFADIDAYAKTVKNGKLSASVSTSMSVGQNASITTKYNKKKVTKGVTFKTSNKKIATVSKKGVVKAVKNGNVTITVKYKKKSAKLKISVKKPVTKKMVKVGSKTVKLDANGGIILGSFKTKNGYVTDLPVAYKKGYEITGWYSGNTEYYYGSKISKNVTLVAKYRKLKAEDYRSIVDLDYLKNNYVNAYYDELQDIMVDSNKPWEDNSAVKQYYLDKMLDKGYCPTTYFNPKAYIQIVKSKYGIELSSYKEALEFYLGCGIPNGDKATLKCIHDGGSFDDSFSEVEYDYYPNVYERYETGEYAMYCGECGKYFYGPTKHDDWDIHMFYICNVLNQEGSGWSWAYDTYDIFYKKEDHEHTDTVRRTYCQNEGKKVEEKLISSDYTPYRTDAPMSYPPDGPVWWYIDKF